VPALHTVFQPEFYMNFLSGQGGLQSEMFETSLFSFLSVLC